MPSRAASDQPSQAHPERRRVVLLVDTSRSYGREIVRGVGRYQRERGDWAITYKPHGLGEPTPPWLREARPGWSPGSDRQPRPGTGDPETGGACRRLAGCDRQHRPAVDRCGPSPRGPVGRRASAGAWIHAVWFLRTAARRASAHGRTLRRVRRPGRAGPLPLRSLPARRGPQRGEAWERQQNRLAQWRDQQRRISQWIDALPKPAAVMACYDDRALQVLDACRRAGVAVPEQVAVISADNDEYLCEMAIPSLTSIDENAAHIGYQAAALLDSLMDGQPPPGCATAGPTARRGRPPIDRSAGDRGSARCARDAVCARARLPRHSTARCRGPSAVVARGLGRSLQGGCGTHDRSGDSACADSPRAGTAGGNRAPHQTNRSSRRLPLC